MLKEHYDGCNVRLSKITVLKQMVTEEWFSAIRQWKQTEGQSSALLESAELYTYGRSITTETNGG